LGKGDKDVKKEFKKSSRGFVDFSENKISSKNLDIKGKYAMKIGLKLMSIFF